MKRKSKSGETPEQLGQMLRFNLGTHKRTRLTRAGAVDSGSLLHNAIAAAHAKKLSDELQGHTKTIGLKSFDDGPSLNSEKQEIKQN